jgi:hypothetical protein
MTPQPAYAQPAATVPMRAAQNITEDFEVPGLPRRSGGVRVGWWLIPVVMFAALLVGVAVALLVP